MNKEKSGKSEISHKSIENELKELEDFVLILKKRDKGSTIEIKGEFVYGCVDNKRTCLMSYHDYTRYKELCVKYKHHKKESDNKGNIKDVYRNCEEFFRELRDE